MTGNISKFKKFLIFVVLLSIFGSFVPVKSEAMVGVTIPTSTYGNNSGIDVNKTSNQASGGVAQPDQKTDPECDLYDPSTWGICATSTIAQAMLSVSAWILSASARLFNYMIDYTLNIKNFINKVPIVYLGWSTFRDFANIIFIFIILYIAINTILGNEGYGIKELLGKTIIAAMLINFSLFFTNIVIDTSNILALQFYNKIISGSTSSDADGGISASFVKAMGLQDIFSKTAENYAENTTGQTSSTATSSYTWWNILLIGVLGSIFILITAFIFLAATGMFLYRSFTLIFLMILSPLAFAGGILPKTEEHAKKWWKRLFETSFYAPAYMAMLYLVSSAVLNMYTSSGNSTNFSTMIVGSSSESLPIVFNFVLLNALMLSCLTVASKVGGDGSELALKWGKSVGDSARGFVGGATFGLAGKIGRETIGRGASRAAERFKSSSLAATWGGRKTMGALRGVASATFDGRNTALGKELGVGGGAKGGYDQSVEEKKKTLVEYGKSLSGKRDDKGYSVKEDFAKRQFGKATLAGFIQKGNNLAGKEIMTSVKDDDIKSHNENMSEMGEYIQTLRDDSTYKNYISLRNKAKTKGMSSLSPAERKAMEDAEKDLAGKDVDYMEYDSAAHKFEKKTKKFLNIKKAGTATDLSEIDNLMDDMQQFKIEALKYRKDMQADKKNYK